MDTASIVKYSDPLRDQLLEVWEWSVLATHHFLSEADFRIIRELVHQIDFKAFDVYCFLDNDRLAGFIGGYPLLRMTMYKEPRW